MQLAYFFHSAPEQIQRDFLEHPADVYSPGCLLYAIYCGHVPYLDGTIFYHDQYTPTRGPRLTESSVPESMYCVLHRSIAKDRDRRYQRA